MEESENVRGDFLRQRNEKEFQLNFQLGTFTGECYVMSYEEEQILLCKTVKFRVLAWSLRLFQAVVARIGQRIPLLITQHPNSLEFAPYGEPFPS